MSKVMMTPREKLDAWCEGTLWGLLYRAALGPHGLSSTPVSLLELKSVGGHWYGRILEIVGQWRGEERWAIVLRPLLSSPGTFVQLTDEVLPSLIEVELHFFGRYVTLGRPQGRLGRPQGRLGRPQRKTYWW